MGCKLNILLHSDLQYVLKLALFYVLSVRMSDSELQYHGRVVDVLGSGELVEQMISSVCASHVNIEVKVVDLGGQTQ